MPRFAIKKLPLNMSSMVKKLANPMSTRSDLGEFEVEAGSIEDARTLAKTRVSDDEPNMICPWREKTQGFTVGSGKDRDFVHPAALFKYNGKSFNEFKGNCLRDQPTSGKFMSKADAKAHYLELKILADEKLDAALTHLKAMNALGVTIDYHMEGDTHGIHEDYMYISVNEGPYHFTLKYDS
jgi:hypothetical protein